MILNYFGKCLRAVLRRAHDLRCRAYWASLKQSPRHHVTPLTVSMVLNRILVGEEPYTPVGHGFIELLLSAAGDRKSSLSAASVQTELWAQSRHSLK